MKKDKPKRKPIAGRCCDCGYTGTDEKCNERADGSHCNHWWDGDDAESTTDMPAKLVEAK